LNSIIYRPKLLYMEKKMRHKVTTARIIGIAVTLIIFFGGLWCSTNLRENGVSWFGLSPEWTGRLGAGVFLILFTIVMRNFGDTFIYGWIKDEENNNEGCFPTKED
jgi:hypothetical protein